MSVLENKILIITGGEVEITSSKQYIGKNKYSKIIAVDGGLKMAGELGIEPDIIIGDFDTVDAKLLDEYKVAGSEIIRLNPVKDDTDTDAAYKFARKYKPEVIDVFGGVGSRFDHSMSNIFLLKWAMEDHIDMRIITEYCRIRVISGRTVLRRNDVYGKYVSLMQFDGAAYGVTLEGLKYTVRNFDFDTRKTHRLGISNEFECDTAVIDVKEGCLLLVEAKEDGKEKE